MTGTWFEQAVDPARVAAELEGRIPEFATDGHRLLGAQMIRLRAAEPDGHWTATYLLEVAGGTAPATVSAHGLLVPPGSPEPEAASPAAFGDDGWQCWLPGVRVLLQTRRADDALPGLAVLHDPARARMLLEELLRAGSPARRDLALRSVTPTMAAYKPGVRATLVCDLDYADQPVPDAWPPAVVAKVHQADEGQAAHEAQCALWRSPLAVSDVVALAEPLGHRPELGLSVQSYLDHELTLKDLLAQAFDASQGTGPDPTAALRATGTALAALHTSGVRHGPKLTWEEELDDVLRKHGRLVSVVPWLGALSHGVPDRLAAAGSATVPDPLVPSHGSFRTAQVLLVGSRVGLIDLDKLCQAEPAADLGPFLSKLRHTAVNKGAGADADPAVQERVDDLRDAFVEAYRGAAVVTPARLVAWEALEHLSLVVGSAKKGLADRAASCAAMMHRHLERHGL